MALVVEDGSGKPNAEAYCTVAFADEYFSSRDITGWSGSVANKEALLRKATEHMSGMYQWLGERTYPTQMLDWPRVEVFAYGFEVASNIVPIQIQRACAELALRAKTMDLTPDLGPTVVRRKVDVLETEYAIGSRQATSFVAVDRMLIPFTMASNSSGKISVSRS